MKFSRKYGQVFLKNLNIAKIEVNLLNLSPGERVLEIGPGHGILTSIIMEKNVNLTVVEPDHRFYNEIILRFPGLNAIKNSFLDLNPGAYDKIIGNIPYNISSQIIFKLYDFDFKLALLMVQREFAERLVASPGNKNYSRLSASSKLRFDIKKVMDVSRKNFYPVPEVDSSIIIIKKNNKKIPCNPDDIIKMAFSMKRKKISSIFKNYDGPLKYKRPGDLSPEDFIDLCCYLFPERCQGS
ncbi:16S rRNA (adenine(1518)-N(6)/adenine(1519)-N(6))-dimethyltransferase RsmA [Picrophilus oshimae]|uniref:Dimethyladenosine transferase n=1 Tax=Picrophilus torridus (strain ATCC 700027 / DSM 9790 / JCM 10055 / NBRC 100828 / KAW 2/3) TaxID=1122961 RepID=Q6L231_PICTO|nr:16S rRNA (adenine(1518)-N(6)/adenine(1519)-N(6))-dimethyltransferase RsmA [Picrophilus oshimae]AAT42971.1 dimethyladenosine transferase [Picrophilus oshimae DSM 9789]